MATRVEHPITPMTMMPQPPSKGNKIVTWLIITALAVMTFAVGLLLYWSFQPTDIFDIKQQPFPVRTIRDKAAPNGVVILAVDYCKKIGVHGKVRVSFVSDTREVFLPIADENSPKQCLKTEVPILIPKDLPPDAYKVKFTATYDINPVKKNVQDEFESAQFEVAAQ